MRVYRCVRGGGVPGWGSRKAGQGLGTLGGKDSPSRRGSQGNGLRVALVGRRGTLSGRGGVRAGGWGRVELVRAVLGEKRFPLLFPAGGSFSRLSTSPP